MRGEHLCATKSPDRQMGSSPLARGAPVVPDLTTTPQGIIPACAGSTTF